MSAPNSLQNILHTETVELKLLQDLKKKVETFNKTIEEEIKLVKGEEKVTQNMTRNSKNIPRDINKERDLIRKDFIDFKKIIDLYNEIGKEIEKIKQLENQKAGLLR